MALLDNIDPEGLFEYSVVFTDRSLNHMSKNFQDVMKSLSSNLKDVYLAQLQSVMIENGISYYYVQKNVEVLHTSMDIKVNNGKRNVSTS